MHQSIRIRVLRAGHEEPLPRRLPRAGKDLLDVAQRQYEAGATLRELANELGIGRERLALLLRDRGCTDAAVLHRRRMRCGRWLVAMPVVRRSNAWASSWDSHPAQSATISDLPA